ncbi:PolC-type DNA polymerase III [Nocardioides sp.]|uniref:PolC-type DNA polymerase III n=1 Tax=Nocardioides sp. TaxID=35761 RepID=UPI003783EB54
MTAFVRPPLRVPDLDVPWRDVDYCVVDVETTGLDLRRDTLVSFGSVVVRAGRLVFGSRVTVDVRPDRRIGVDAMTVHGLRHEDLEAAPPLADVADRIVSELDGRVLVAHAAWIERAILREPVRLAGRRWRPAVVDTAALLRATGVAPSGTGHEPDLEWSAEVLHVCPHSTHHALGDALTTAEVLLALASRLEQERPGLTARSLVKISRAHTLT